MENRRAISRHESASLRLRDSRVTRHVRLIRVRPGTLSFSPIPLKPTSFPVLVRDALRSPREILARAIVSFLSSSLSAGKRFRITLWWLWSFLLEEFPSFFLHLGE
jgi:hypothetical protein